MSPSRDLVRGQSLLIPIIVFVVIVGVLFGGDPEPGARSVPGLGTGHLLDRGVDRVGNPPSSLLTGALAHLAAALTGTPVGLACARPIITRAAWSFVTATVVVLITAAQPWLPPVGAAARALATDPSPSAGLLVDVLLGLVLLALAGGRSQLGGDPTAVTSTGPAGRR